MRVLSLAPSATQKKEPKVFFKLGAKRNAKEHPTLALSATLKKEIKTSRFSGLILVVQMRIAVVPYPVKQLAEPDDVLSLDSECKVL